MAGPAEHDQAQMRLMWKIAGLAFMMSSEVAAGALLGWLLDHWLGTGTRWLTIGGIIGIIVGMTSLIRGAWTLSRQQGGIGPNPGTNPAPLPDEDEDDDDQDRPDLQGH